MKTHIHKKPPQLPTEVLLLVKQQLKAFYSFQNFLTVGILEYFQAKQGNTRNNTSKISDKSDEFNSIF